jgi:hypothetical protein
MDLTNAFIYIKEEQGIGEVISVDFKEGKVSTICEEEHLHTYNFEDVVFIHEIGKLNDEESVFNYDIFKSKSGNLFELEDAGNGMLQFHLLNEKLERQTSVDTYSVHKFFEILKNSETYELFDNRYELLAEQAEEEESAEASAEAAVDMDFNIKVVRKEDAQGKTHYYYAAKDTHRGQIDLIAVVFVGAQLLEEQYKRIEMPFEEYIELVKVGTLVEASPYELQGYAMEKMRQAGIGKGTCCGEFENCNECPMNEDIDSDDEDFEYDDKDARCDDENCECNIEESEEAAPEAPVDYDKSKESTDNCKKCHFHQDECECELWEV